MSNQRPIFNSGLYGKANRTVMNAFMESADTLAANQGAIDWAYRASMPEAFTSRTFLARIQTASVITAGCRWSYSGTEAVLLSASPWHETVSGTQYDFTGAINLREIFNSSSTDIDGMDLTSPASTVGPVGSYYSSGWVTSGLEALVVMTVAYTKTGAASYYFDRPNPIRCT
jgi:hypothetical protein